MGQLFSVFTKEIAVVLIWVVLSGGFGAFLFGISSRGATKKINRNLKIPFVEKPIDLGFVGDILVGIGASISILYFAAPLFNIKIAGDGTDNIVQIISLSIISGFAGTQVLTSFSSALERRVEELSQELKEAQDFNQKITQKTEQLGQEVKKTKDQVQETQKITEKTEQNMDLIDFIRKADENVFKVDQKIYAYETGEADKKLDEARGLYEEVLEYKPNNVAALIGLAMVLKRKGYFEEAKKEEYLQQAIVNLDKVLEQLKGKPYDTLKARAYYNRACYKYLLLKENLGNYTIDDVLTDLQKAIDLKSFYKELAQTDKDFDEQIKENKEFQTIIGRNSIE